MFLGSSIPDHLVGTTVKYNPTQLDAGPGLRVAIVPTQSGRSDAIRFDEAKNLVVCPVPHDGSFMQLFHESWRIAQALCESDFKMPKDVDIPNPVHREAARVFAERRDFPVQDVIDATAKFAQPHLLDAKTEKVPTTALRAAKAKRGEASVEPETQTVVSPFPLAIE